jgi:hypothetical protein
MKQEDQQIREAKLAEIWDGLVEEHYPNLMASQRLTLKTFASSDWLAGAETDLSDLFEKYVVIKTLKGLSDHEQ